MAKRTAGIYARISSDETGDRLGVDRQIADCTAEAKRRGWSVSEVYTDNDVSATRSKRRPEYLRMLTDAQQGHINALVVWDVDRLTRTPRELEDVIDLADRVGLSLASVGGEIDLATPQGRMTARIKGSVARHETEQSSRRIRSAFDQRAAAGKPHGMVPYGYRREDGKETLDRTEASLLRSAAKKVLAGQSLRSIVADFNDKAMPAPRGGRWNVATLRQVLIRDRNAGLRVHRGKVVGRGTWPALWDEDTHFRLVALIRDPGRRTNKGAPRKHLLSGIARCGHCGAGMVVNVGRVQVNADGSTKRQLPAYTCPDCTRIRRKQSAVDDVVERVIVARLSRPDALSALAVEDPVEIERARDAAQALEARLAIAADSFADGTITADQLRRITAKLRPQIEQERATVARATGTPEIANLAGTDAVRHWAAAPLEVKRAVIEMLCKITILPSGSGKRFDPALIRIEPKS